MTVVRRVLNNAVQLKLWRGGNVLVFGSCELCVIIVGDDRARMSTALEAAAERGVQRKQMRAQMILALREELSVVTASLEQLMRISSVVESTNPAQDAHALVDALEYVGVLRSLPPEALAVLPAVSRGCRAPLSPGSVWRQLYSAVYPMELPMPIEPSHPLSSHEWRRLYLERRMEGDEVVAPCVLHTPDAMARATLDPGAVHLIEAYLRRLCQQLAKTNGVLSHVAEDRRDAILEASRLLLAQCDAAAARAAIMVLRQAEKSEVITTGTEAGTCWSFECERNLLSRRYRELVPVAELYKHYLSAAEETIESAQSAVDGCTNSARRP